MRHLTAGDKSLFTGDLVAELLLRYAALLGQEHTADTVQLRAQDASGNPTTVDLLLNQGLSLTAETVPGDHPEPDNRSTEHYIQSRIDALLRHQNTPWDAIAGAAIWNRPPD